jgi:hypothetical protein
MKLRTKAAAVQFLPDIDHLPILNTAHFAAFAKISMFIADLFRRGRFVRRMRRKTRPYTGAVLTVWEKAQFRV